MVASIDPQRGLVLTPFVEALNEQRRALLHCVESMHEEAEQALENRDKSDLYDETPTPDVDAEQTLLLTSMAEQRLEAIDAAMARIDAGTYGLCTRCGEWISPERLTALPSTAVCVNCAGRRRAAS
jgi:RNA polymerase-binding transcription factor DksA